MRSGEETDLPFTQRLMKSNKNHTVCLLNPEYSQASFAHPRPLSRCDFATGLLRPPPLQRWNTDLASGSRARAAIRSRKTTAQIHLTSARVPL
jgi:hypothetical protein